MSLPGGSGATQDTLAQDATSELLVLRLINVVASTTLTAPAAIGATTVTVASNVGMAIGQTINFRGGQRQTQATITALPAGQVTVDIGLDVAFATGATVEAGPDNANVLGTAGAPVMFAVTPPVGVSYHIVTLRFSILDNVAMDLATFGGIAALTNGLVVQFQDGASKNFGTIKNNLEFQEAGFTINFEDKAPAGSFGITGTVTGPIVYGVVVALDGTAGDEFRVSIRDDLRALTSIKFIACGHVVVD